jgi:hypothetical protein
MKKCEKRLLKKFIKRLVREKWMLSGYGADTEGSYLQVSFGSKKYESAGSVEVKFYKNKNKSKK